MEWQFDEKGNIKPYQIIDINIDDFHALFFQNFEKSIVR